MSAHVVCRPDVGRESVYEHGRKRDVTRLGNMKKFGFYYAGHSVSYASPGQTSGTTSP